MNRALLIPVAALGIVVIGAVAWQMQPTGDGAGRKPAAEAPAAAKASLPAFDVVRVESNGSAVIAGRALPNATINILDGDKVLGTVVADARGEWVFMPSDPLAPGARELRLEQVTDGGTVKSEKTVVLAVPERDRDLAGRKGEGKALAVLSGADGSRVLQAPRAADRDGVPRPAGEVSIDTIDYDRGGKVTVGGQAKPGTEVMLYLQNNLIGRAKVDADGRWTLTPGRGLDDGQYSLRVDQVGPDSKVVSRAEVNFDKKPIPEQALAGRAVVVVPGNNLWAIARRTYGEGLQYTVIFEANQGQIRDPDLIYPGQIFLVPDGK